MFNNNNHRLNTDMNIKQNYFYSHKFLNNNNNNDLVYYIQKEKDILNTEKIFDNDLKKIKNSLNSLLNEQKLNKKEVKIMRGDSASTSSSDNSENNENNNKIINKI